MADTSMFIGTQVSLISKIDIRYEGTLAEVDMVTSKLKLLNVRSFGTEGRKTDGPQIAPLDRMYDAVVFNGHDIKALNFVNKNTTQQVAYNDPAIIQSQVQQQPSPVINPSYPAPPAQITNLPPYQPSLSLTGTSSSSFQKPSQFTDLLYQPSLSTTGTTTPPQNTPQITNLPLYRTPSPQNTPQMQIPNLPLYQPPSLSTAGTTTSPQNTLQAQIPKLSPYQPLSLSTPGTSTSAQREQIANSTPQYSNIPNLPLCDPSDLKPLEKTQMTNLPSYQQSSPSLSSYPTLTNLSLPPVHPNPTTGTSTSTSAGTVRNLKITIPESNSTPNPSSSSSINAVSVQEDNKIKNQISAWDGPVPVQTGTSGTTSLTRSATGPLLPNPPNRTKPILPLPRTTNTPHTQMKTGPVQYGRSGSYNQNYNRGRGPRGFSPQYGGRSSTFNTGVVKYTEDFDFEAMNERFKKDEVWGQLGREMSHNNDIIDSNDDNSYDEEVNYHSDDSSDAVKLAYKKDDFFDSLSGSQNRGSKFNQHKLNTETFGGHVPRYGRGFRGTRGRGGGYYNNSNNYNNNSNNNLGRGHNSNPNPNSEANPNFNRSRSRDSTRGYFAGN